MPTCSDNFFTRSLEFIVGRTKGASNPLSRRQYAPRLYGLSNKIWSSQETRSPTHFAHAYSCRLEAIP